ncbi:MAG: glutathione S-transferase family protein [Rhodospirillales bacterium]
MAMTLYDLAAADPAIRFSPNCWRTRMAVAHKGLELDCRPWRFVDKDAIAFSDQGTVPVLVDGERTVYDSWQIALYLEERYPGRPHLFESRQARAHARFINEWTAKVVHPGIIKQIILPLFEMLDEGDKDYFRTTREKAFGKTLEDFAADGEAALPAFRASLTPLRGTLEVQDFLGGSSPSYADYVVFSAFQWARVSSPRDLLTAGDPIAAWRERMLGLFDGLGAAMPARAA